MASLGFEGSSKAAQMQALPCFALGFDSLSCTVHIATVHTGAVVQKNAVAMVILILVMWAVTATLAGPAGVLETKRKSFSSRIHLTHHNKRNLIWRNGKC